jgi:hypothetical protein
MSFLWENMGWIILIIVALFVLLIAAAAILSFFAKSSSAGEVKSGGGDSWGDLNVGFPPPGKKSDDWFGNDRVGLPAPNVIKEEAFDQTEQHVTAEEEYAQEQESVAEEEPAADVQIDDGCSPSFDYGSEPPIIVQEDSSHAEYEQYAPVPSLPSPSPPPTSPRSGGYNDAADSVASYDYDAPRVQESAPEPFEPPMPEPPVIEPVHLGASAPRVVKPNQEFTVRFTAYIESLEEEVEEKLKELSPRSTFYDDVKQCQWLVGTKVAVKCRANYLDIQPAEDVFVWNGTEIMLEFDARVLPDAPEETTILKFDVLIGGIPVAKLRIDMEISATKSSGEVASARIRAYTKAFASYSSEDRTRVLDRVSEISRNGVKVFLDCLSLNPGEVWKTRLEEEMQNSEMFLLFWSASAKKSEWVTWEWQNALKLKGIQFIEPHPLDPVEDAPPPDELKDLHFNDYFIIVRETYEDDAREKQAKQNADVKGEDG